MTYTPTPSNTANWWINGQPTRNAGDVQTTPSAPQNSTYLPTDEISYGAAGLMYSSVPMTVKVGGVITTTGLYNPNWILLRDSVFGMTWAINPYATADIQTSWGSFLPGFATSPTAYCVRPNAQLVLPANTVQVDIPSIFVGSPDTLYTNSVATTPAAAVAGSGTFILPSFSYPQGNSGAGILDMRGNVRLQQQVII